MSVARQARGANMRWAFCVSLAVMAIRATSSRLRTALSGQDRDDPDGDADERHAEPHATAREAPSMVTSHRLDDKGDHQQRSHNPEHQPSVAEEGNSP